MLGVSLLGFLSAYIRQNIQDELDEQRMLAKAAADRLEEELQRKTTIYTSIAHEVKTPLTIIRGYFSQYRRNNEDSTELQIIQDNLDRLERRAVSLLKLERELLAPKKPEDSLEKGSCNLSSLIEKNLPLFRSYFQA